MDTEFKYRVNLITGEEIAFIRKLIANNPDDSRRKLSFKLCQAWNRVQKNGAPRDMVCRGMMLELHRAGHINLPAKKQSSINPFLRGKKVKTLPEGHIRIKLLIKHQVTLARPKNAKKVYLKCSF